MIRTVADIMVSRLVTFAPDMNIHEAIRILLDKRLSGAPVVDATGALVGMLSKKDCLRVVFASQYYDDWGGPVRDYMSTSVETMDADLDLVSAVEHFLGSHFRRFPVLRDGKLVGQVSRYDILQALTE
jgi:CBS domain-containing protein